MKKLQYKGITIIALMFATVMLAQKQQKKSIERFNVDNNVVIDVNTRYTDIEIETWDKNEVVVEAYIVIEDKSDQNAIDDFLKNWNFNVLGNKSSIKISSKSSGLIDIHSFDFNSPDYDVLIRESMNSATDNLMFALPEFPEMPELPEMAEMPEMPELPEIPEMPELPPMPTQFDFEAYKKDKNYLERWKKENKDIIGKNAKIKVGRNSLSIDDDNDNSTFRWNITQEGQNELAEEIQERIEETKARREEYKKRAEIRIKERQAEMKERQKELQERFKEHNEDRKLALIERQEAHERRAKELAKHRDEVKYILAKRERVTIKRLIKIKAPKNAKFNMNVRYGSMSFPK